jgi:predicted house-cleaning noncanonical NTP pyrophosphatase (MazG superfamily)
VKGKLVRDLMPELIRSRGQLPVTRIAEQTEYEQRLKDKLLEETAEFLAADWGLEELADVLEIVLTLADYRGISPGTLESARTAKLAARGGFSGRVIWLRNAEAE